jgi:hypothetical protein
MFRPFRDIFTNGPKYLAQNAFKKLFQIFALMYDILPLFFHAFFKDVRVGADIWLALTSAHITQLLLLLLYRHTNVA